MVPPAVMPSQVDELPANGMNVDESCSLELQQKHAGVYAESRSHSLEPFGLFHRDVS